jgi:hypothetical protein
MAVDVSRCRYSPPSNSRAIIKDNSRFVPTADLPESAAGVVRVRGGAVVTKSRSGACGNVYRRTLRRPSATLHRGRVPKQARARETAKRKGR